MPSAYTQAICAICLNGARKWNLILLLGEEHDLAIENLWCMSKPTNVVCVYAR